MAVQVIAVVVCALALLWLREAILRAEQRAEIARMREDREVAQLEDWFDLDWTQP